MLFLIVMKLIIWKKFTLSVFNCLTCEHDKKNVKYKKNTINIISNNNVINFDLSMTDKKNMFKLGFLHSKIHFENKENIDNSTQNEAKNKDTLIDSSSDDITIINGETNDDK